MFVRESLIECDLFLGFCIWYSARSSSESYVLFVDRYDLIFHLGTITREEYYILSYGDSENSGELMYHIGIGDRHVDRQWECDKKSLHSIRA